MRTKKIKYQGWDGSTKDLRELLKPTKEKKE